MALQVSLFFFILFAVLSLYYKSTQNIVFFNLFKKTAPENKKKKGLSANQNLQAAQAWLLRRISAGMPERLFLLYSEKISHAGLLMRPEAFYALKIASAPAAVLLGIAFWGLTGSILLFFILTLVGILGPDLYLRKKIEKRQARIRFEILDAVEMLQIPISAGVSLTRAVKMVSPKTNNVVIKELELCFAEIDAGKAPYLAFRDLVRRNGVGELERFVQAVQYSQSLGTPMSLFLTQEAERMRNARRARLQEAGQKIGTKVMVAGIVIMGPAFLILMLGPIIGRLNVTNVIRIM